MRSLCAAGSLRPRMLAYRPWLLAGGDAEARRHPDLHDSGRRAAEPGRPPGRHLRDGPCDGAVLQRADAGQSGQSVIDTTQFVCDLCTEMPKPTDDGKTYTFKIRTGVKFHDGIAADRRRRGGELAQDRLPAEGRARARAQNWFVDGGQGRGAGCDHRHVPPEVRHRVVPAGARRSLMRSSTRRRSSTRIRTGTRQHVMGSGPFRFVSYDIGQSIKGVRNPDYYHKGQPYLDGFIGIFAAEAIGAGGRDPRRPRGDRIPRPAAIGARSAREGNSATRSRCRPATGTAAT